MFRFHTILDLLPKGQNCAIDNDYMEFYEDATGTLANAEVQHTTVGGVQYAVAEAKPKVDQLKLEIDQRTDQDLEGKSPTLG